MCLCLQTKKRYAKEWAEAEKASQQAEKAECEVYATKVDVEKVNTHMHALALLEQCFVFSLFLPLLDFVIFSLHELLLSVSRSPPCVSSHHLPASIPAFHFAFCFVSLHFFFLLNPFILPSLVSVVPSALHSERPSSMPMLALTRQRSAGTTMQQNSRNTTRNRTTTITPTYRSSSM